MYKQINNSNWFISRSFLSLAWHFLFLEKVVDKMWASKSKFLQRKDIITQFQSCSQHWDNIDQALVGSEWKWCLYPSPPWLLVVAFDSIEYGILLNLLKGLGVGAWFFISSFSDNHCWEEGKGSTLSLCFAQHHRGQLSLHSYLTSIWNCSHLFSMEQYHLWDQGDIYSLSWYLPYGTVSFLRFECPWPFH